MISFLSSELLILIIQFFREKKNMKTTRRTIEWKIKYVKFKNPKKISELLFDELSTSLHRSNTSSQFIGCN